MVFLDFERRHRTESEKRATLESVSGLFLTLGWVLPNIPPISGENNLESQFWLLYSGIRTAIRDKKCSFLKPSNGPILKFWILKVLCDVYPNQEKPFVVTIVKSQTMFQLLVSIDIDMIVNVSGGERRPDGDVRFEDDEGDESCKRDKTN